MDEEKLGFARIFDYAGNSGFDGHGYWCMERLYSVNNGQPKEVNFAPVVCHKCFNVIYEKSNCLLGYYNKIVLYFGSNGFTTGLFFDS